MDINSSPCTTFIRCLSQQQHGTRIMAGPEASVITRKSSGTFEVWPPCFGHAPAPELRSLSFLWDFSPGGGAQFSSTCLSLYLWSWRWHTSRSEAEAELFVCLRLQLLLYRGVVSPGYQAGTSAKPPVERLPCCEHLWSHPTLEIHT